MHLIIILYINRVIWQNKIQVWLARESTILKTAATLQKPIEIKVKVVKLISISAAVQLLKSINIQDSKIYTAFLDWCIEVQDKVFHPDVQMIDLISVCSNYLYLGLVHIHHVSSILMGIVFLIVKHELINAN